MKINSTSTNSNCIFKKAGTTNTSFMGNTTGFLQHTREMPQKRTVAKRVNDYNEYVLPYTDEKLIEQSGRCMNCGVPFCHNGCPLGNIIPEFNNAVYNKEWKNAYDILSSTNNFPEFTGRLCPAPQCHLVKENYILFL